MDLQAQATTTVHNAESAISVTSVPHTFAAALVTAGNGHRDASHVKHDKVPSEQATVALLAVYPVSQATVHDAESAI